MAGLQFAVRRAERAVPGWDGTRCAVRRMPIPCATSEGAEPADWMASWLEVFERDPSAHVLAHPQVVLAEARGAWQGCGRPGLLFEVAVAGVPSAAAAILPKDLGTRSVAGFGPSIALRGYVVAGKGCLAAADGEGENALGALVRDVAEFARESRADFVLIEDVEPTGTLWDVFGKLDCRRYRVVAPRGFQERLRIRLPEDVGAYWASFSGKTRNTFRRKVKKLGRVELERITATSQVPDFLAAAHAVSRNTWQSERLGLRVRNDEVERELFSTLAELDALRSYLLRKDGEAIAFLMGNQFRGYFSYEEVGYDRRFARQSPGQVLLIQCLEDLFAHDRPDWFDFGGGDAEYKRLFANHQSKSGNVWIVPRSARMEWVLGYLAACRGMERAVRTVLARTGFAARVRRALRRGETGDTANKTGERQQ